MIFLLLLSSFLCSGHPHSEKLTVNGTSYFNITGTIYTRVVNSRDILDRESDVYKDIAKNFTLGFGELFPDIYRWLHYTVTVQNLFIWPTRFMEYENSKKVHTISFVVIAQHKYQTTSKKKGDAQKALRNILWLNFHEKKDNEGYITSRGLKVEYDDCDIIPEPMKENIINGYMAFITRIKNSYKEIPTINSFGNSTGRQTNNSSIKARLSNEQLAISYIAYTGITLSTIGLFITMTSICYFRRLRKFRRNQILVHICATIMAGMLLSLISFTYNEDDNYCTALAVLLHYFILAALSWMCIEAYNLYKDIVKVFNTNALSSKTFTLRACIFGYGLPVLIVGLTSGVDITIYGRRNDACWMTSLGFLVSFLVPVLCMVTINIVFFSLIMREIIQVSQRDANIVRPSLRAAVSLSVLLGFCWLLAGISTFTTNPFVTYAFVILSSFQGLFIFIFHGIGKQELRDSWKTLSILNWQFNKFNNSDSRGKTESTTQDTPQVTKRFSKGETGKLNKDSIAGSACDVGCNQAFTHENALGPTDADHRLPGMPETKHEQVKKIESNC